MPSEDSLLTLDIPTRIKPFVYAIGMLGFPIIVASYVLVVTNSEMKGVRKELTNLATRIDERPMGLEKSTDFVIFLTDSLRHELLEGLPKLIDDLDLKADSTHESKSRQLSRIKRHFEGYVRPIVRKHQRFAERFPSAGGNLGNFFLLSAPSEDIEAGETEGYLTGETSKHLGEALLALLLNNIAQFGHSSLANDTTVNSLPPELRRLIPQSQENESETVESVDSEEKAASEEFELISPPLLLELSCGAVDTAVTALKDQMLVKVRLHSTETE